MPFPLTAAGDLIRKAYVLARPYGRGRLAVVTATSLLQGVFQVLGVTSIFPFLALAADPSRLRHSDFGRRFLASLPAMDDSRLLLVAGIMAVVMLFASNGVNILAEYVRTRYAHNFGHWLRVGLLRKIASRPYGDFLQAHSAVLVKKVVGDVMQYTTGVLLPLLDSLARAATIILLVGTLFLVHPQIALIASLGLGVFYFAVYRSFGKWRRQTSHILMIAQRGVYLEAQQLLGGIKTAKVHAAESSFIRRFTGHSAAQARLMARASMLSNCPRYLVEPLAFGGMVVAVMIYASRGQDLAAILPNLGVMALAGYRLLPAFQLLYGQLSNLSAQRHSLDEVYDEFLAVERAMSADDDHPSESAASITPLEWHRAITLDSVTFQYPGSPSPVIKDLSLVIPKNSSLGVIGSTGCGKSTLADLVLGLHHPTSGRILIDNTPLSPHNRRAWRLGIGYVPQDIFLIDDTIAANIAFGVERESIDHATLRSAAAAAQILTFIEGSLPQQFETVVGERGVRLSGGQRQRIGLARALYHSPDLLILDEATSALDTTTEDEVMRAIDALRGRLTIVIIAHRLSTIRKCDAVLEMGVQPARPVAVGQP